MKVSTTDGREYWIPDFCPYCNLDTGGSHEAECPNRYILYYGEEEQRWATYEVIEC